MPDEVIIRIVHLSDIHFSKNDIKDGDYKFYSFKKLVEDLKERNQEKRIDLILISGDLLDQGGKSFGQDGKPYEIFENQFIKPLQSSLMLSNDSFYFAPGNHDVVPKSPNFSHIDVGLFNTLNKRDDVNKYILDHEDFEFDSRLEDFKSFEKKFHMLHSKMKITPFESTFIAEKNNLKIGIACLNSSWRSSPFSENKLLIGEIQIDRANELIEGTDLKIAVVHHPLECLQEFDRNHIKTKLQCSFNLVFSGHDHKGKNSWELTDLGNTFYSAVNSNCSTNVQPVDSNYYNGYAIIDCNFTKSQIIVNHRCYSHYKNRYILDGHKGNSKVDGISIYPLQINQSPAMNNIVVSSKTYSISQPNSVIKDSSDDKEATPASINQNTSLDKSLSKDLLTALKKHGLINLATSLNEYEWKYKTDKLKDFFSRFGPNSEMFIVARSMETWLNGHMDTIADLIVSGFKFTCVIPAEQKPKSLVLSDESQWFHSTMWSWLNNRLVEAIKIKSGGNPKGLLKIYEIPTYVPSTFIRIKDEKGNVYCGLEPGIGIPKDDPKVYIYFEDTGKDDCVYRLLTKIYNSILLEREPFTYPVVKLHENDMVTEDCAIDYENFLKVEKYRETVFANRKNDYNFFNKEQSQHTEMCISISSMPISECSYDIKPINGISELCEKLRLTPAYKAPDKSVILFEDKQIDIPIYYLKYGHKSIDPKFSKTILDNLENDLLVVKEIINSSYEITILFDKVIINNKGEIQLLGTIEQNDSRQSNPLTFLRNRLFEAIKCERDRFYSRKPDSISCIIGYVIENGFTTTAISELIDTIKSASIKTVFKINKLRVVSHTNIYVEPASTVVHNTYFLNDHEPIYKTLSTKKWLHHQEIFENVKGAQFELLTPVTVQVAPSMLCNYHCPNCSYGKKRIDHDYTINQRKHLMPSGDLMECLRFLGKNKVKGVIFTGGGEPLLNPAVVKILASFNKLGNEDSEVKALKFGIFTNGSKLDRYAKTLFKVKNLSFIRISINAGLPKEYALAHGCKELDFHKVIENITLCAKLKLESYSATKISIGLLISPLSLFNIEHLAMIIYSIVKQYPGSINSFLLRPAVRYKGSHRPPNDTSVKNVLAYLNKSNMFDDFSYIEKHAMIRYYSGDNEQLPSLYQNESSMADNGNQLPQKLFNKALAIIEEKIKPILEDKEIGVKVGYPLERILDLNSGYQSKKCLAKRLVSFISNEKKVYPCVEKAFIEEELGTFKRDSTFSELFEKSNLSMTTDCPPICLLHELNKSFENIQKDGFPGGLKILSEPASEIDDDFYFL